MSEKMIKIEDQGAVTRLTINRPEAMNALNRAVLEELDSFFSKPPSEHSRFVSIHGAGEKAFVAGADIAAMSKMNPKEARDFSCLGQAVMSKIEKYLRPVVAFVNGFALGGGCELALACDFIIASSTAKFGQPEVGLGLIPGFGGTQRLIQKVGAGVAADMILTGQAIDSERALALGLCSRVLSFDSFNQHESTLAKVFSRSGVEAVSAAKKLIYAAKSGIPLEQGLALESETFASCFYNGEGEIGMQKFLSKSS